jgi:hypothetical protein
MKQTLSEFSTGYPSSIGNSQSQEYGGVLGPIDAETVRSNNDLNARSSEGLHKINMFMSHFFRRPTLNPANEINNLRVRLNHLNLDFPFDNKTNLEELNNFTVTEGGNAFGVTPTTDLSKGFDTGSDLPRYNLEVRVMKMDGGYKLEGKLTPKTGITEETINKSKREDRINKFKEFLEKKKGGKSEPYVKGKKPKMGKESPKGGKKTMELKKK